MPTEVEIDFQSHGPNVSMTCVWDRAECANHGVVVGKISSKDLLHGMYEIETIKDE